MHKINMDDSASRLRMAREAAGYASATDAAKALGVPEQTYYAHENSSRGLARAGERYAKFFGVSLDWLMTGRGAGPKSAPPAPLDIHVRPVAGSAGRLPIRYRVAAGTWMESDQAADEPLGWADILPRPGIADGDQWAEIVVGDSFNMRFPEGTILHVCSAFGAEPRKMHGKRVVVERVRDGGHLRERTVKEIVVTAAGEVELWPRSFNPKWSEPIKWRAGLRDGDEVKIAGIVLSATLME